MILGGEGVWMQVHLSDHNQPVSDFQQLALPEGLPRDLFKQAGKDRYIGLERHPSS
jgi:hypothetical protein